VQSEVDALFYVNDDEARNSMMNVALILKSVTQHAVTDAFLYTRLKSEDGNMMMRCWTKLR